MICPNCETDDLQRTAAVDSPNWRCQSCGVQFAILNPSRLNGACFCDECRWFTRGECRKGHTMEFRLPMNGNPHDDEAGFRRFECGDHWPQN